MTTETEVANRGLQRIGAGRIVAGALWTEDSNNASEIRACYDMALDSAPGLRGSVTASWHISAAGTVSRSSVASSTLGNGRVEGCVTRVIKGWVFKNPDAVEAEASWSFQFAPPN